MKPPTERGGRSLVEFFSAEPFLGSPIVQRWAEEEEGIDLGPRTRSPESVHRVQGISKERLPGCVKSSEKVAFCLPTAGRKTQFFQPSFSQPGKHSLEIPCRYITWPASNTVMSPSHLCRGTNIVLQRWPQKGYPVCDTITQPWTDFFVHLCTLVEGRYK